MEMTGRAKFLYGNQRPEKTQMQYVIFYDRPLKMIDLNIYVVQDSSSFVSPGAIASKQKGELV
jgi:hypothetical protein